MNISAKVTDERVLDVRFDAASLIVDLMDGRTIAAPLAWYPRLLDATPARGQRMLFSATLDKAIDVLVKRFLTNAVTHEADSAQSPVASDAADLVDHGGFDLRRLQRSRGTRRTSVFHRV